MTKDKSIYKLELHETVTTSFGICIMRVASGWLYDCWDLEKDCWKDGLFVPYANQQNDFPMCTVCNEVRCECKPISDNWSSSKLTK